MFGQLDPETIEAVKSFAMAFPTVVGMLAVMWINERRSERREKRVADAEVLRERVWVDVAKQNNRVATDGQRLQEKTLDMVKDAAGVFSLQSQNADKMESARLEFVRRTP